MILSFQIQYSNKQLKIICLDTFLTPFSDTEALFVYRGPVGIPRPMLYGGLDIRTSSDKICSFCESLTGGFRYPISSDTYVDPSVYLVSKITTSITMFILLDIGGSLHGVVDSKSADA